VDEAGDIHACASGDAQERLAKLDAVPLCQAVEMGWLPPSPDGIAMCQVSGVEATERKGRQP